MLKEIAHVGLTVSDLDRSIDFYQNVLGLRFVGEIFMEGENTDKLFAMKGVKARVAYLNGSEELMAPPVELIQFLNTKSRKSQADLNKTSISEICFKVEDIHKVYKRLKSKGVEFLSEPQYLDLREFGCGESWGIYFKDTDGIILELVQPIN